MNSDHVLGMERRHRGRMQRPTPQGGLRRWGHGRMLSVAFVSSFPPRRCGIASFTADLAQAVRQAYPYIRLGALALDPAWEALDRKPPYAGGVDEVHPIVVEDLDSYLRAAQFLETGGWDVINVQHEYGLFGGDQGEYVLHLLRHTRLPVVATLHTVLRRPDEKQRQILVELAARSRVVVVQARSAVEILQRLYGIDAGRVVVIPHGTPSFPSIDPGEAKRRLGFQGRPVLLTYGLLSPGKGIEQAIRALPAIKERVPSVLYVVAGQTHPNVLKLSGESYRQSLVQMAAELGLQDNVQFVDRYLGLEELGTLLAATDVYVVPYPNEDQVVSGTLSYALAAGKAVVSTPFRYAREVVGPGRGLLCQFGDPGSLAREVLRLLDNPELRRTLEHRALAFGQSMSWDIVGSRYGRLFRWVADNPPQAVEPLEQPASIAAPTLPARRSAGLLGASPWREAQPGR
ncbi:MAG: glycosyltransferase family 4 protein [Limnochordaceae bacterium]|nr:glycosyltransferase family 4 protein [Limnochordaceae bacterium]